MGAVIAGVGLSTESAAGDIAGLDAELGRFAEAGCEIAELSLQNMFVVAGGRLNLPELRAIEAVTRRHPLRYTAHGPLGTNFMDEAHIELHRAVCTAMIEAAGALGATRLVVHGGVWTAPLPEAELARLRRLEVESLAGLAEHAERHGVTIALENLPPLPSLPFTHDAFGLAAQVAAVGHPAVGATLDIGHAYMMATLRQQDLGETLAAMAPHIVHIHLQDQFGRLDTVRTWGKAEKLAYGTGDLHAPPGWGDTPFEALLPKLSLARETTMIMELAGHYMHHAADAVAQTKRLAGMVGTA
ncbi:sugar phosphate isomerase/epimerase family protein [Elioraea rosea]|uniref:sugar phosphate isomerase/epimerase family protein n=1 Tax=Elioraea rosea TaxID=2492390 RepID=UPI00131507FB|nr:sugar phosphate isomerase/epimerase family protein [Elioraea rosea]